MLKELLSDFVKVVRPSFLPETFQPYLSMILTVIVITILAYGAQTTTTDIHNYANNPSLFKDKIQSKLCGAFINSSILYICSKRIQSYGADTYAVISPAQDIHKLIN